MDEGVALDDVVVIDVETTGLGEAAGRIDGVVQIGVAWLSPSGPQSWAMVCNPGEPLLLGGRADEALAISKIPLAAVRAAPSALHVATELRTLLWRLATPTSELTLLAFNAPFDRSFLCQPPWDLDRAHWGPCLMRAAAGALNGGGSERIALWMACQRLGVAFDRSRAHDAAADARAALGVWQQLRTRGLY